MAASKKTQRPQGPLVDAQRALAKKEAMARQVRIEELRLARERARGKRAEDERALRELTIDERRRDRELRSRRDRLERERREEEERRHQEEAEALKKRIEDLEKKIDGSTVAKGPAPESNSMGNGRMSPMPFGVPLDDATPPAPVVDDEAEESFLPDGEEFAELAQTLFRGT